MEYETLYDERLDGMENLGNEATNVSLVGSNTAETESGIKECESIVRGPRAIARGMTLLRS